jgi:hypothetical protein
MSNHVDAPPLSLPNQPFLFPPNIVKDIEEAEERGEYTLERIKQRRPGLIEAIIDLRSRGEGLLSTARMLRCDHRTVQKVEITYPEEVAAARSKRVLKLRSTADKLVETIAENPGCVPGHARALAAAQLYDKAELLDGRATVRSERVEQVNIYADWEEFVEKQLQPDAVREIPADSMPIPALKTGSDAEKNFANNGDGVVSPQD